MKKELDLAIIGAGIIGVCTAWYARKLHPRWVIGLFDQGAVGSGATFYSASLDLPHGHTPLRYQLAARSRSLFSALRKELPGLPIKDLPFYGIVLEENAPTVLAQLVDAGAMLSPEIIPALLQEHPQLVLPQGTTVISGATASQGINNDVAGLLAKNFAATPGSFILEQTKIESVQAHEDIFHLQASDENCYHSKRVVQATGPWMNEILGEGLAAAQKTRVKKIVAFHIYEQPIANGPLFYFFDDDAFLMPKYEAGYWLFSFKCDHWDVLPDIKTLNISGDDIQKAQGILKKYYPHFAPMCTGGRVFCDAYTSNSDPVIEQATGHSNYVVAGGGAGSGFRLAPAIAEAALLKLSAM